MLDDIIESSGKFTGEEEFLKEESQRKVINILKGNKMKEFVLKDMHQYTVRVKTNKCLNLTNLNHIEFVQETKNDKGEVVDTLNFINFLEIQLLKSVTG